MRSLFLKYSTQPQNPLDGARPMPMSSKWRRYLRFWGNDLDADLAEEFRFHLETEVEDLVARGMTPDAARADALRRFGCVSYYREFCRRADHRRTARERRANLMDVLL